MSDLLTQCTETAEQVERYVEGHLFDPAGLMYSGIDCRTGKPFERDLMTPIKVPRRARLDPWAYWTYEDTILTMGLYIDGLVLKYELTGDRACLERAGGLWRVVKNVYSCSQVHGIGTFLRPYGGYEVMSQFMEPLGTDQASPLFHGLYRYMKHADDKAAADITRVMLQTIDWYAAQNFEYLYYKSFIHSWHPDDVLSQHANSYYIPAIAWAAKVTGDGRWREILEERLKLFTNGHYNLCPAFVWGTDLTNLADIMAERFGEVFTSGMLDAGYQRCREMLAEYDQPGVLKRVCPESVERDFEPCVDPDFDQDDWSRNSMGFAYFSTRHGGLRRPRHEIDFLIALATLGCQRQETMARALELLSHRRRVPEDFTDFLYDDHDELPETVHLYALSVGVHMVQWWRNYWFLRATGEAT